MTSDIVWSKSAQFDLARIDDYYRDIDPDFANRTGRNALAAARFLLINPFAGPKIEGTRYRKWHVPDTPFLLFYRPENGRLLIQRVRHYREDWQPIL
ncbi:type II toxin-antitoxin system RelE/ParE family toxin [Sphingopyxis terrae subsp. ummariensis]|nr:type II toxin-antitoxin system RelE/ParE family toxin [Sphingopyxis terrae]